MSKKTTKTTKTTPKKANGKQDEPSGFRAGTNGWQICKIVADGRGKLTLPEVVQGAEQQPIASTSIPNRVKQVLADGRRPTGRWGGLFEVNAAGQYKYIGPALGKEEDK